MTPKPSWIWPGPWVDLVNRYAQYRYDFDLSQVPSPARLHITADQSYQLWINGTYVCRGPARGYQAHWPVDEVEVSPFLREGHNWISVLAHTPGVSTFQYLHHKAAGVLLWADEPGWKVITDATWLCRMDPSHATDTPHLWVPLSFQEHVDLSLDDRMWITDSTPPTAGWRAPNMIRPMGSPPWHSLEPRGLPLLTTHIKAYHQVCSAGQGPTQPDNTREPVSRLFTELPGITWQSVKEGTVEHNRLCFDMPAVQEGQCVAKVLDMGQPTLGEFILDIRTSPGESWPTSRGVVDVLFCETLDAQGQPDFSDPDTSMIRMGIRLTLESKAHHFEAFQLLGHRYAVLVMRGPSPSLRFKAALRETIYPLQVAGRFESNHSTVNDIYRICVHTQRICMLDSYVDTPWREQAQWWGDARVQAWNTFHLSSDTRLLRRGLAQIGDADQALPNGLTYGHAPTIAHNCVLPDFTLIWMLTLWDDYFQTGQTTMFETLWPRVEQALGYFATEGRDDRTGLLCYDPRYWLFLDWSPLLPKEGMPTLLNLWYLYALDKLIALADAASMEQAGSVLKPLRDQSFKAIMSRLFCSESGLFCDGLTDTGQVRDTFSIHNQTLAILAGLAWDHHAGMVQRVIKPYLLGEAPQSAQPSSYWMTYVYTVAQQNGLGAEVLDHLVKHWSPMIESGGTWEKGGGTASPDAQVPGRTSVSHAWSAHPIYHLAQTLGGITQTHPGWQRVRFEPVLNWRAASHIHTEIPSPHGLIVSEWNRTDVGVIQVDLTLPLGVTADIYLPGIEPVTGVGPQSQHFQITP